MRLQREEAKIRKARVLELEKTIGVEQNRAHSYDVWEHILRSLQTAAAFIIVGSMSKESAVQPLRAMPAAGQENGEKVGAK